MDGWNGDTNVQFIELRITGDDPNAVGYLTNVYTEPVLCFFDDAGVPYARFDFKEQSQPPNTAYGSSILIGTSEFASAWGGQTDFTFHAMPPATGQNGHDGLIALVSGVDPDHPIRLSGKIAYGQDKTDWTGNYAFPVNLMCKQAFTSAESVAYGAAYSGPVDYGTKVGSDLPSSSNDGLHLQGPACWEGTWNGSGSGHSCSPPRDNSVDYAIVDLSGPNAPRNNAAQQGELGGDLDEDGVSNQTDACPNTALAPVDSIGCSDAQVDSDGDGFCDPGAVGAGPSGCTGSDVCPALASPNQLNSDGDGFGDECDTCPHWVNPLLDPGYPIVAHQAMPLFTVPPGDDDCDGFPDAVGASGKAPESYIGTDPIRHCAATSVANDEAGTDAWAPDFNDDRIVNGQDTGKYGGPFGAYNKMVSAGPFGPPGQELPGARFNFNGDGVINGQDTGKFPAFFAGACYNWH